MTKKYDYIVYIGRLQPPTLAHITIIKNSLKLANKMIVLAGSSYQPRTIKNPWTWQEREQMVRLCLDDDQNARTIVRPLRDVMYNDQQWATSVQNTVQKLTVHPTAIW